MRTRRSPISTHRPRHSIADFRHRRNDGWPYFRGSKVKPFSTRMGRAAPVRSKWVASLCVATPGAVVPMRSLALSTIAGISDRIAPLCAVWVARSPANSPTRNLNLPLIHLIATSLSNADATSVRELAYGIPTTGSIPANNVMVPRILPSSRNIDEWRAGIPGRSRSIAERFPRCGDNDIERARWEKTLPEAVAGCVAVPRPLSGRVIPNVAMTPRFAILGEARGRPRQGAVNRRFPRHRMRRRYRNGGRRRPARPGYFLATHTADATMEPTAALRTFSVDYAHAYKNRPLRRNKTDFATIAGTPPGASPKCATFRAQPRRSSRSHENWEMVTKFPRWTLAILFGVDLRVLGDACILSSRSKLFLPRAAR